MHQSERFVQAWLKEQGATKITYNSKGIDFDTDIGLFEVKVPEAGRVLWFQEGQLEAVLEAHADVVVVDPRHGTITRLPCSSLTDPTKIAPYRISVFKNDRIGISVVNPETVRLLELYASELSISYAGIVDLAMRKKLPAIG